MNFEPDDYIKISGLDGLFLVVNSNQYNEIAFYIDPVTGETMGVEFCDITAHYRNIFGEEA